MLIWQGSGGFSLDASVRIHGTDRTGRERLLRYCARPPLALERMSLEHGSGYHTTGGGPKEGDAGPEEAGPAEAGPICRVLYCPARPLPDGRDILALSPLEFLAALARLIPPPPRTPPAAPVALAGRASSPASTITESTADGPKGSSTPVRITHAFHPLFGEVIDFVERRHNWGEDRVFYRDRHGHLASMPAGWTSVEAEDPHVVVAAGRSWFRTSDLVELARLVAEHRL